MAQVVKFAEMAIAGLSVYGYEHQSITVMFVALGGFGVMSTLFGPVKYGILPDHLPREKLPAANALIEGATFIAILTGTITAGLAARDGGDIVLFGALVMAFSLACWLSALFIPPSGEGAPHLKVRANIASSTVAMFTHLRADRRLWWGAMVTSWFWVVGIVVLSLLPPLIKDLIGGNEDAVTACLALFSIAVGIGSGIAAKISHGRIVLTTTIVGAVLLGAFALDLGFAGYGHTAAATLQSPAVVLTSGLGLRVAVDLFGMAVAGGLVHRAGLCRGAGVVGRRLPRPHHRRGQRAQRRLHDGRHPAGGGVAEVRRHGAAAVSADRRGLRGCRAGDLEDDAEGDLTAISASPAPGPPSRRRRRDNSPDRSALPASCGRRAS